MAKWLSEEALQIAEKRREAKGIGEKESYSHLKEEFQRTARRDKKAFLSDQCKEIDENSRMGKTKDLFKKIRDTKGTFHTKMGTITERNGMDLREAEDSKKRWQKTTQNAKAQVAQSCLTLCDISNFLEISNLSHSVVFLYFFALFT